MQELTRRDAQLREAVHKHGVPEIRLRPPGFATLIQIILEQQVSVASGVAVYKRLKTLAGGIRAANIASLGETRLRGAGLSRQKARYCHKLALAVQNGDLRMNSLARQDDDTVRERLMSLPGIGRWTADIYLLLAMGRPDVWPAGDLALQLAQAQLLGLAQRPGHAQSHELAERWRPWRSVAARIHWHAYLRMREAK